MAPRITLRAEPNVEFQVHRPYSWVAAILWMVLGLFFFGGLSAVSITNFLGGRQTADYVIPGVMGLLIPIGTLVGAIASIWGYLYPRTFGVSKGMIVYYVGQELVGQVPLDNIRKIDVIWEQQQPNAMMYGGGLVGAIAIAALSAAKKKPTTIVIKILKKNDPDTFWPTDLLISKTIRLKFDWDKPNDVIVRELKEILGDDDDDD
jgi:hypothetical protein